MDPFAMERRAVRLRFVAAMACVVMALASAAWSSNLPPSRDVLESVLMIVVVLSIAAAIALVADWWRRDGELSLRTLAYQLEYELPRPRRRRPKRPPKPTDPAFWMKKLATRLARLGRFLELKAPETIIENERRLIRDAIAELSPGDALAVMRAWPHLATQFDPQRRRATGDKPN